MKFHVPVGCQLITIFISVKEYNELYENADRIQIMCNGGNGMKLATNNNSSCSTSNTNSSNNNNNNNNIANASNAYPFQFKKKIMKRDKSIVFTNIPEEVATTTNGDAKNEAKTANNNANDESQSKPSVRPNHLPLRFKNITSNDIPESGFSSSITFDEQDSFPQFIGRTSVCSTPMTENKVLHGNIMPIFNTVIKPTSKNTKQKSPAENTSESKNGTPIKLNTNDKFDELPNTLINSIARPFAEPIRRNSLIDIGESFRKISQHLSMRPISAGFTKFMNECDYVADGKMYLDTVNDTAFNNQLNNALVDYDCDADAIDDVVNKKQYRTITDPTNPVFNSMGQPISRYLYDEILNYNSEQEMLIVKNSNILTKSKQFDQTLSNNVNCDRDSISKATNVKNENLPTIPKSVEKPPLPSNNSNNRKSLTLPLKSLTSSNTDCTNASEAKVNQTVAAANPTTETNLMDKLEQRKKFTGIQLTPLISKLSFLAMNDERSSGFSSWDTTPGIELATPIDGTKLFRRRSSIKAEDTEQVSANVDTQSVNIDCDENDLKKVELFICGQNNMTMLLLIEEGYGQKQEIVQSMVIILNFCITYKEN